MNSNNMKKRAYLFIVFLFVGMLAPYTATWATGQPISGSRQLCWKESECLERRQYLSLEDMSDGELKQGFIQNSESDRACGGKENAAREKLGYCLPAGQAETAISFGGRNRFDNVGEFIAFLYRYGTWAATIIAVFVVVIGGIQWMVSGGNSATIDSAKRRIGGAIMGIILLGLSYTILNILNPYLVNFRLPNVWLVNEIELTPPLCSQLRDDAKLIAFASSTAKYNSAAVEKFYEEKKNSDEYNQSPADAACGTRYLVEDGGTQLCSGTVCKDKFATVCQETEIDGSKNQKLYNPSCSVGDIVITYEAGSWKQTALAAAFGSGFIFDKFESPKWLQTEQNTFAGTPLQKSAHVVTLVCPNNIYLTKDLTITGPNGLGGSGEIWIETAKPQTATTQTLLVRGPFSEHDFHYGGLDKSKFKCPNNKNPIGFLFRHDLKKAADKDDPNLWVGMIKDTQTAVVGTFQDVQNLYIPYKEATQGGLYLKAFVGGNEIKSIFENEDSGPPLPKVEFKGVNIAPATGKPIVPAGPAKL